MIPLTFVRSVLLGARVDLSSEKAAQAGLALLLHDRLFGVSIEREVRLSASDIVDILVDGGVAVEVKLRGAGKMAIFRQLRRYATCPQVRAILLVSNTAMGLPEQIEGKPAAFVSLGAGWL